MITDSPVAVASQEHTEAQRLYSIASASRTDPPDSQTTRQGLFFHSPTIQPAPP
jgi:hypothetical protein